MKRPNITLSNAPQRSALNISAPFQIIQDICALAAVAAFVAATSIWTPEIITKTF